MNVFSKISELYEEMWKAIIRPPRDFYTTEQLGPPEFYLGERRYKRRDFELRNRRGLKIECSHFEPVRRDGRHDNKARPCVIYMHGNCSSRLESIHCGCLKVLLPLDVSVVCFDFTGSGLSEGDYVSLGWFECEDLAEVVAHLRTIPTISTIGLWGRSMGAVTACLFADQDPSIAGLVIDSPFSSLRRLAEELAADFVGWKMPKFILAPALSMVRNTVMQKANFDLDRLEPIRHCSSSFIPALFIAGKEDVFIRPDHARALHDAYAGDKNFILVDGNHNSFRPDFLHDSIAIFFRFALQLDKCPRNASSSVWEDVATAMAVREKERREGLEKASQQLRRACQSSTGRHLSSDVCRRERTDSSTSTISEAPGVEIDPFETSYSTGVESVVKVAKTNRSEKYRAVKECRKSRRSSGGEKRFSHHVAGDEEGHSNSMNGASSTNGHCTETRIRSSSSSSKVNMDETSSSSSLPSNGYNNIHDDLDDDYNSHNGLRYEDFSDLPVATDQHGVFVDVAQQYAIWMSLQQKLKENTEKKEAAEPLNKVKEGNSQNHQCISEVVDYIPEANIEELLEEFRYEEDLIEKLKAFESEVSSSSSPLNGQTSSSPLSSKQTTTTTSNSQEASSYSNRLNMVAPHRVILDHNPTANASSSSSYNNDSFIGIKTIQEDQSFSDQRHSSLENGTPQQSSTSNDIDNDETDNAGLNSSRRSFKFW